MLTFTQRKGLEAWMQENQTKIVAERPNLVDLAKQATEALHFNVTYANVNSMRKLLGLSWPKRYKLRQPRAPKPPAVPTLPFGGEPTTLQRRFDTLVVEHNQLIHEHNALCMVVKAIFVEWFGEQPPLPNVLNGFPLA